MKLGKQSKQKLSTCHSDLQKIINLAITRTNIDFGISEGHRDIERQYELFLEGKSKIDGINKKGKHNYDPSLAVDIFIYHPEYETRSKLAYDKVHLAYVSGIITCCAEELFEKGEIENTIRWGANWDGDGVIDYDQSFDDYPHFELI